MTEIIKIDTTSLTELETLETKAGQAQEKYEKFKLENYQDKEVYRQAKTAKSELVSLRTSISKTAKLVRDEANKFAKSVIQREKYLIRMISPIEDRIKGEIANADNQKIRDQRRTMLPIWRVKLAKVGIMLVDEDILDLSDDELNLRIENAKAEKEAKRLAELEARELEIKRKEEELKIKAQEQQIAEEKAKKLRAIEEQVKLEEQAKIKAKEEAIAAAEAAKAAKLEKDKAYQEFKDTTRAKAVELMSDDSLYKLINHGGVTMAVIILGEYK